MKFILNGPNKGKTVELGGFEFKNGVCEVPDGDADAASRILCRYYDAVKETDLKKEKKG